MHRERANHSEACTVVGGSESESPSQRVRVGESELAGPSRGGLAGAGRSGSGIVLELDKCPRTSIAQRELC